MAVLKEDALSWRRFVMIANLGAPADNHRVHAEARWFGFTNGMSTHGPR